MLSSENNLMELTLIEGIKRSDAKVFCGILINEIREKIRVRSDLFRATLGDDENTLKIKILYTEPKILTTRLDDIVLSREIYYPGVTELKGSIIGEVATLVECPLWKCQAVRPSGKSGAP